ncbi:MAG: hypothetical protein HUU20_21635 [Pirellulales bacterium]|nr:hypothetical protein [Pirellulales bacterium]
MLGKRENPTVLGTEDLAELMADARRMSRPPEDPSDHPSRAEWLVLEFPKLSDQ